MRGLPLVAGTVTELLMFFVYHTMPHLQCGLALCAAQPVGQLHSLLQYSLVLTCGAKQTLSGSGPAKQGLAG
jgi:hypothetical protein